MAQAKIIVAGIARIDAPTHPPVGAGPRAAAPAATIHLADGQTAHLDPADSRTTGRLEVLAELQRLAQPVSLEVDAGNTATALRIPLVVRVERLAPDTGGDIAVALQVSAAAHHLRAAHPDFRRLLQALKAAAADHGEVLVTETDAHDIIDVRPFSGAAMPPAPRAASGPDAPAATQDWTQTSITQERFLDLLELLKTTASVPRDPAETSIPFNYPDNGCWARAHEMCRLLMAQGVTPGKAWVEYMTGMSWPPTDFLKPLTRNHPACRAQWLWHVAPVVPVNHCGVVQNYVFDPATEFLNPETLAIWWEKDWKEYIQVPGAPSPAYHYTDWTVYQAGWAMSDRKDAYDSDYTKTKADLLMFRTALKNRFVENGGIGPPFGNCTPAQG